ncbi:MAG: AraC family transcriptional regulator [Xanthobacteraceae bacterium]|nr:AraC family transcriptional regulator [Xanthobacteraceae bacterium]
MLNSPLSISAVPLKPFGRGTPSHPNDTVPVARSPVLVEMRRRGRQLTVMSCPAVDITPQRAVARRGIEWNGIGAECVKITSHQRVDFSSRSPVHLLAVYEQGVRREGESYVEGAPRSKLRDVARKLTFAPAGHVYHEWHDPRIAPAITYFYFDPAQFQLDSEGIAAGMPLSPRLFFEDEMLWNTAAKLKQAIESPTDANRLYVEALGVVLIHELTRLNGASSRVGAPVSGGLAAWQQRIVTAYIEEHLADQIPLASLARLARLSTFHFCRAFKQSLGIPPHRYHTSRRIERAKAMLAERRFSVTEVGMNLGFSGSSSFTAVFRKVTGQTPSQYHRALE